MTDLYLCLRLSMEKGLLQKVIFSKPLPGFPKRIDGRLSYLRGEAALTTETPLAGGKVLHKHYPLSGLTEGIFQELTGAYRQINLITAVGNCEYKKSNGGSEICIGGGTLFRQLAQADSKGFTDIVLQTAVSLQADVILSTPCCHHYLESRIQAPELSFVTDQPFLRHKLAETLTDGLRVLQLTAAGYKVTALELTDPENTPKNTLIRAVRQKEAGDAAASERYQKALHFLLGDAAESYLAEVQKP